jgi:3-phosphoshikimate 1-carboxyvinyltransferase
VVREFSFNFVGIMALPELIEIVPLDKPVRAEITVPGSKSITNRALILAALADGEVTLTGALWSEDTQIMVECLQKLGFEIRVENDSEEFCNRTITVKGLGGKIPNAGTAEKPLELFVGNAGTAARFLSAFVCLGNGVYRLSGVARMHERPQAALFSALIKLGYKVESENNNEKLPVLIFGAGPKKGECGVDISESSQFASALLLSGQVGEWQIHAIGDDSEEFPYVIMTQLLINRFPNKGGTFLIEPDASSGSYFAGVGFLFPESRIIVNHWPNSGWQIDEQIFKYLEKIKGLEEKTAVEIIRPISPEFSRLADFGDSVMTGIVLAPFNSFKIHFKDLARLRVQECDRVTALRTELTKCGAKVVEEGDTLTVWPSPLHGAEIETYNDHRMAMCFAILGLKVPGIKIKNPACVKKTFPNFFQKLAAPPPHGLGAEIWEIKNSQRTRKLSGEDLFAD